MEDYVSVTETEHYATDVEHLRQLCDYIIASDHDYIVYTEFGHHLLRGETVEDLNMHMDALLNVCRIRIKHKYPLIISASTYDFDKAVNEMSNVISMLDHQQDTPLRDFCHTIYSSYNECKRRTANEHDVFPVWCDENVEMYGRLKMVCRKLKKEPRGIIEGVEDRVYI